MSSNNRRLPVYIYIIGIMSFSIAVTNAAEWKSEPSISFNMLYNDNVRMRSELNNPEGSTGFTLVPRVELAGEEQRLWDMSIDAQAKITRYQDIEDGDSENLFFVFDGGRKTERSDWRLNTSYSRNTNFDTDFNTENPDAGLLDDRTERTTASISPSVNFNTSETSLIKFSLNATDVSFDEVSNANYKDYNTSNAEFVAYWLVAENHQLGFTTSYTESDTPDTGFSYDQAVLQLDYTYTINQISSIDLSFGGRRLNSLRENVLVACEANNIVVPIEQFASNDCPLLAGDPTTGQTFPVTPVLGNVKNQDDGTVINVSYKSKTETSSHSFSGGRTISPSSFGGAQEVRSATYQLNYRGTERLSTNLILDVSESSTIDGTSISFNNDRTRYRFEPSISYRLTKNWNLQFIYRYIEQNFTSSNADSVSNAVYVNLYLDWPRLATTY